MPASPDLTAPPHGPPSPPAALPPEPEPEVAADVLAAFLSEADDYLTTLRRMLPLLRAQPEPREPWYEVRRCVHTLKGAAGMVGLEDVAHLTRRMEDLLSVLYAGQVPWTPAVDELLGATCAVLETFIRAQGAQGQLDPSTARLYEAYTALIGEGTATDIVSSLALEGEEEPFAESLVPAGSASPALPDMVRVPLPRVDELVRLVSEVVISRAAYEQHVRHLRQQIEELRLSLDRLRRVGGHVETTFENDLQPDASGLMGGPDRYASQRPEFDALEFERYHALQLLARDLYETTADLGALEQEFGESLGDFEGYLVRHSRLTSEIQDQLMRLRMVPLATLATRLHRAVRVAARQQDKEVILHLQGDMIAFDKSVLEQMAAPLLHLLRHTVEYSLEPPAQRLAQGKPREGHIYLQASAAGTQVLLQVRDDGTGLLPQRLGARDMESVQATVARLKGSVELTATPGQGTACTMRLPLTLAIMRVLLVQVADDTFAVPLVDIERVLRLDPATLEHIGHMPVLRIDEAVLPVMGLRDVLQGHSAAVQASGLMPAVMTQAGTQRVVWLVDHLVGGREVVVKTLGNHLQRVPGILGATLLGDGQVVLILNVSELLNTPSPSLVPRMLSDTPRRVQAAEQPAVLIVDDSLSVRRVVSALIRRAGWQALTAKDGVEALGLIQHATRLPEVILLDIETPHMDGYELTSTLRAQEAYRDIPVVMLTSRMSEASRQKAFAVGAAGYLVKPYQDEELLALIRRLVPRASGSPMV